MYVALETPSRSPPLHGKYHLIFPFWLSATVPYSISQVCGGLDDCPGTETLDGGEDEEGCEGV